MKRVTEVTITLGGEGESDMRVEKVIKGNHIRYHISANAPISYHHVTLDPLQMADLQIMLAQLEMAE